MSGRDLSAELFGDAPNATDAGRDLSAELFGAPAANATQYVRTGTRSDGVRVGLKADGTQEVIK